MFQGFQLYCGLFLFAWVRHALPAFRWTQWSYPDTLHKHRGFGFYGTAVYGLWHPPVIPPKTYIILHVYFGFVLSVGLVLPYFSNTYVITRFVAGQSFVLFCTLSAQLAFSATWGGHKHLFPPHVFLSFSLSPTPDLATLCTVIPFLLTYLTAGIHKIRCAGFCQWACGEVLKYWVHESLWGQPLHARSWRTALRRWILLSQSHRVLSLMMMATLVFELAVPLLVILAPLSAFLAAVILHVIFLVILDLDYLSYYAITWCFIYVESMRTSYQSMTIDITAGLAQHFLPIMKERAYAFASVIIQGYSAGNWGSVACLLYFAIHLGTLITLQDQNSWLPFSSLDMFSEAPTLFDKSWDISLVCHVPVRNRAANESDMAAKKSAASIFWDSMLLPHFYTFRATLFNQPEIVHKIRSHYYLVFGAKALISASCQEQGLSGLLLSVKDGSMSGGITLYSNVEISACLRGSCEKVVDILRRGNPGDEWDYCTMKSLLQAHDAVQDQLRNSTLQIV